MNSAQLAPLGQKGEGNGRIGVLLVCRLFAQAAVAGQAMPPRE